MNDARSATQLSANGPLGLSARSGAWKFAAVVLGSLLLTLSSYVSVPMIPVPVTLQTFAVMLIGALYGWRLGALTVMTWLGQAAVGLPVLAGGNGGWVAFVGPTAGYLVAFPLCAALAGWLAQRGWNGRRPWLAFVNMLLGNLACLIIGAAWLAALIGPQQAIALGVTPFLVGGVLKSALGAVTLKLLEREQDRNRLRGDA
ncbi:biotin transporter BioY [Halomonas sp. IOP_31]|uniref:biotin transporter BioY n=1 Tax=Halomonas sp. IOP_31 TaxID=2876584 RepID=UPI001E2E07D0|nr:biotin transporter BioY [Halomonas sp. IOP_31]MCD6008965.1 biotin transporter BioY [Halomonas sp. IOP_31]